MKLKPTLFALALVAGLAVAGCGSDDKDAAAPDAASDAATAVAPASVAAPATALPPPPQLKARSFIVIDHTSGRVLAALEPDARQEPASLTKLMTAYVVFHSLKEGRIKLGDMVTVSENAWRQAAPKLGGSAMYIEVGTQVSIENLLQGMIVQSGNDPKERAEHVMLIDLARNDIGRIAKIGSVKVTEAFTVERYSHVMHIVSNVEGLLNDGMTSMDVLKATFPAGTLTGAPKVHAMEVIDQLEPTKRGLYGGACGYLSYAGDMDVAIAIRTGIIKDGTLYVQAAAGVVADSVPEMEWRETEHKARALLRAAELVEEGLE